MRILLDQGIFDMRNAGQNALLQVAVQRFQKLWPNASIEVTTFAPHILKIYFPGTKPVSPDGQHDWFKHRERFERIQRLVPPFVLRLLLEMREKIWYRWPNLKPGLILRKIKSWFRKSEENTIETQIAADQSTEERQIEHVTDYHAVVSGYDLMVATGSQYLTDIAKEAGIGVLDRLETAINLGIPTAMVGQGIGPINDPELYTRAKAVLPKVDLICVRERQEAPKVLEALGVNASRVMITGDDALELAYKARADSLGKGIGVSLRVMSYTEVGNKDMEIISKTLKQNARKHNAQLVSLPISQSLHERDDKFIQQVLDGYDNVWISKYRFQTPEDVIKNAQRCRLVVTGTFHGAVFAIAQGIPVICLARGASYVSKLTGLADLFGLGCNVIHLDEENLDQKLSDAIDSAWDKAEQIRPYLLDAAARQIESGNFAYHKIFEMFESRVSSSIGIDK